MYEINNITKLDLKSEIEEVDKYLKYLLSYLKLDNVIFSVIIVDNKYIRQLNKDYRDKDVETDVISFALEDEKTLTLDTRMLGDIYISYDKVIEQSLNYEHSKLRELLFLVTHGVLHLLGYDHQTINDEKTMFTIQEEVLSSYGIKR
ncbi:MAG: rRNA maturation RNase YbeY [Bacilli bacterium]